MSAKAGRRQDDNAMDEDFETPTFKDKDEKKRKRDRHQAQEEDEDDDDDDQPYNSDFEQGVKDKDQKRKKRKKDRRQAQGEDDDHDDDDDADGWEHIRLNSDYDPYGIVTSEFESSPHCLRSTDYDPYKIIKSEVPSSPQQSAANSSSVYQHQHQQNQEPIPFVRGPQALAPLQLPLPPYMPHPQLQPQPQAAPLYNLSDQQKVVAELARSPNQERGRMVCITAAPGSGKTFTLINAVVPKLVERGHERKHIQYITFNKNAATDVKNQFDLSEVNVNTMNSLFMGIMKVDNVTQTLWEDNKIQEEIQSHFKEDIGEFLEGVDVGLDGYTRTVARFIFLTLEKFMQSSHDENEGFDPKTHSTCFDPEAHGACHCAAITFHKGQNRDGERDPDMPLALIKSAAVVSDFYTSAARKVWQLCKPSAGSPPKIISHDSILKRAQLEKRPIPFTTALLVDEFQDLTPCQLDLIKCQAYYHKMTVFIAGDLMQGIYYFSGADPLALFVMQSDENIEICDRPLTRSFRFGPEIASMANLILFVKEKSPQALPQKHSYRIEGCGKAGSVTKFPLKLYDESGKRQPYAVIYRKNATGIIHALNLMATEAAEAQLLLEGGQPPRPLMTFHLLRGNGPSSEGETLGTMKNFTPLFKLFMKESSTLDSGRFKGLSDLEYDEVVKVIFAEELGDYFPWVALIKKYGANAGDKFDEFLCRVLHSKVSEAEADVILGTVHAWKGKQCRRVQLLNDFISLAKVRQPQRIAGRASSQFEVPKKGDDIHLMFTAMTRAIEVLSLSPSISTSDSLFEFVEELEKMHDLAEGIASLPAAPASASASSSASSSSSASASVSAPLAASLFVTAAAVPEMLAEPLLGLPRTYSDVKTMHEALYLPLKAEQNQPINNGGLVIDGYRYYKDAA